ncbi:MAG TPA: methyltransferase domain-containing protein [Streptosporangiaceae bacterium]
MAFHEEIFAQPVRDYSYQCLGRPIRVLQAGCAASADELGLDKLRDNGFEIQMLTVDQDHPRLNESQPREPQLNEDDGEITVGDLRTIPLSPRSFDIVHCSLLLDRINHVTLVLDRLGAALRPGGLLLLRIRERDCAAGFLDRTLPRSLRRALWRRLYPGQPGPFPAIYEQAASARGIAAYMLMRGLVVAHRKSVRTLPAEPARLSRAVSAARATIARFSRGRLTDAHDQVLFVVRKPEDRFARVVLVCLPRRARCTDLLAEGRVPPGDPIPSYRGRVPPDLPHHARRSTACDRCKLCRCRRNRSASR